MPVHSGAINAEDAGERAGLKSLSFCERSSWFVPRLGTSPFWNADLALLALPAQFIHARPDRRKVVGGTGTIDALAAEQLVHARADRFEIIGGARSGHVFPPRESFVAGPVRPASSRRGG
jgi:hypothetical protein